MLKCNAASHTFQVRKKVFHIFESAADDKMVMLVLGQSLSILGSASSQLNDTFWEQRRKSKKGNGIPYLEADLRTPPNQIKRDIPSKQRSIPSPL